jgi:hypothetical protein
MNEYVRRLTAYVGDRPPLESLRETAARVDAIVRSIRLGGRIDQAYGAGKWSARQVICHLADVEVMIGYRMRQIIATENHVVQPIDENAWAVGYRTVDPDLALRSFLATREWNLSFLQALPANAWSKAYRHPEQGDLVFDTLICLLAGHDINHLSQLEIIGP